MNMGQEDIEIMHQIQLELLQEVDRICRKCGIHYGIVAGTLLGAVRHGGFIPWDKDADIGMVRKEYDKFAKACESHMNHEKFYFQDHRNTKGYRWGYGKVRRKDTILLREGQEHMPYSSGVGIDIFPLDHVPESYVPQVLHHTFSAVLRKFTWCHIGKIEESNPNLRLLYFIMDLVPEERVKGALEWWIAQSNRKETPLVRILMFPTLTQYRYYYKRWYTDLAPINFEEVELMGARDYEGYLTFKFGDYRTPPPKSEQVVDRNAYWNFTSEELPQEIEERRERKKQKVTLTFGLRHKKQKFVIELIR